LWDFLEKPTSFWWDFSYLVKILQLYGECLAEVLRIFGGMFGECPATFGGIFG
jgi:hypothetical protein